MNPTPKLVGLFALGLAFAVLSELALGGVPLWVIYDAALLASVVVDFLRSPSPRVVDAGRSVPTPLSLGEPQPITITVHNHSPHAVRAQVKDEPPAELFLSSETIHRPTLSFQLAPGQMEKEVYEVTPLVRGRFPYGAINVRIFSRWGLLSRQRRIRTDEQAVVYPSILAIRRYHLLLRSQRLHESGIRKHRLYARGTEFERVRDYTPDDEFRAINWTSTARRGRLMVNQYQEPRNQSVMLLLDAGRVGAARIGDRSRLDHAVNAALLLAYAALDQGDHVGVLAFADQVLGFVPPGRGHKHLRKVAAGLAAVSARPVESDYDLAINHLRRHVHKRSLVAVFTDLSEEESAKALAQRILAVQPQHVALCLAISDPEVHATASLLPTASGDVYEKAAAVEVVTLRRRAAAVLRRRGVTVVDAPPSGINPEAINAYLELKSRGRL